MPDSPDKISWYRAVLDTRDLTFLHFPYNKPIGALFNPEPKPQEIDSNTGLPIGPVYGRICPSRCPTKR